MQARFNLKPYYIMSGINFCLVLITGIAGVFCPETYVDFVEPLHLAESQGQDVTSLFIGLPLLILSIYWTRQCSVRGPIFWAGVSGYFLYIYLIYAYGGVYNRYFFAYVAICGLSLFSLIGLLRGIDPEDVARHTNFKMPFKLIAVFFMATAILLIFMWGALVIASIIAVETADANVIIVTDFIAIIPALILAAIWIWQRKAIGLLLSGVLFVQAVTLGISIVIGQVIVYIKGDTPVWGLATFFLVFTLIGLCLSAQYVKNLNGTASAFPAACCGEAFNHKPNG